MDKIKKQALEAAGWKFGDAEDFLNEGRTMNIDEAIEIATSTAITLTKLEMAEVAEVLAAEVERLRAITIFRNGFLRCHDLLVTVYGCLSSGQFVPKETMELIRKEVEGEQ
jgi:hypothetical protein